MIETIGCRLCGGEASHRFTLSLLGRAVGYFNCAACGSLETEPPTWLAEAYAWRPDRPNFDVGAAQRTLTNAGAVYATARLLGLKRLLDFGGGDGFLCRLMRDYGWDAYVHEPFGQLRYASDFAADLAPGFDLVSAFEVLEHLSDPAAELGRVLECQPTAVLATTRLYSGQGADWDYLAPEGGQHVFFYSERGLRDFVRGFGYAMAVIDGHLLFCRGGLPTGWRMAVLRQALRPSKLAWTRAWALSRRAPGIGTDVELLRQRPRLAAPPRRG